MHILGIDGQSSCLQAAPIQEIITAFRNSLGCGDGLEHIGIDTNVSFRLCFSTGAEAVGMTHNYGLITAAAQGKISVGTDRLILFQALDVSKVCTGAAGGDNTVLCAIGNRDGNAAAGKTLQLKGFGAACHIELVNGGRAGNGHIAVTLHARQPELAQLHRANVHLAVQLDYIVTLAGAGSTVLDRAAPQVCGTIDTGIGAATSFTDSHNYGNITVESSVTLANTYIGGIYASINANTGITNCSNKGNISFNGTATNLNIGGAAAYMKHATCQIDTFTNSGNIVFSDSATAATAWLGGIIGQVPSLSTATAGGVKNATSEANITVSGTVTSQLIMGGISGSYATKNQPMENCKFTGEIDIKRNEANSSTIKELYLGGIIGSQASQVATLTNATFAGKITYRAKSTDICRIGGIIGSNTQSTASWSGLVSAGTIDFQTNTEAVNYLASKTVIGGVIANTTSVGITGAKSHCDIYVLHLAEGAKYGMVLGVDRTSTILAKNCEVGGMIYNKWDDEEEVYDGTKLSSNNYYNYIYGSGKNTDWGDSTNYDGNIFLATKPTVQ